MTHVTPEDYIAWATPEKSRFVGYATSEDELRDITDFVTAERRQWLIETFRSEVLKRQGTMAPVEEEEIKPINFSQLPLLDTLSYDEHKHLVDNREKYELTWLYGNNMTQYRPWRVLAEQQSLLGGFSLNASKYSNTSYANEPSFKKALTQSRAISHTGYPISFLMEGAKYVQAASLDLSTVQTWIETRDHSNYPPIYHTPYGFWPRILEAKKRYDEMHGHSTYNDVAQEVDEGVFVAPYIPVELIDSGEYVSIDSIVSLAVHSGETERAGSRAFNSMLEYSTDNVALGRKLAYHMGKNNNNVPSGVLFFHSSILGNILERMLDDTDRIIPRAIAFTQLAIEHYRHPLSDERLDMLVFET